MLVERRLKEGILEYKTPFTLNDVRKVINFYKMGGEKCTGKYYALYLAERFIGKDIPDAPRVIQPWDMT
jgi:hypothetical protein